MNATDLNSEVTARGQKFIRVTNVGFFPLL